MTCALFLLLLSSLSRNNLLAVTALPLLVLVTSFSTLPPIMSSFLASMAEAAAPSARSIERAVLYHDRTKHQFRRHARSLGYMDWANQPNPWRYFEGSQEYLLPFTAPLDVPYSHLFNPGTVPSHPVCVSSLSKFLELSLGITAWKQAGKSKWALRSNPSSGNLHPTEGYLVIPQTEGLPSGLYHYVSKDHSLEHRAAISNASVAHLLSPFPRGAFLLGLASIHWREAWKYGERAFRYCNHDVGHAIGTSRIAAAALGWNMVVLDGTSEASVASLLGTDRSSDFLTTEEDHADLLAVVWPQTSLSTATTASATTTTASTTSADSETSSTSAATTTTTSTTSWRFPLGISHDTVVQTMKGAVFHGKANKLCQKHEADWEIIDEVANTVVKHVEDTTTTIEIPFPNSSTVTIDSVSHNYPDSMKAEGIVKQRRSAVDFQPSVHMSSDMFFRMLHRIMPSTSTTSTSSSDASNSISADGISAAVAASGDIDASISTTSTTAASTSTTSTPTSTCPSAAPVPWDVWPYASSIHVLVFVHRVDGVAPGLYMLLRDLTRLQFIKDSIDTLFEWKAVENPNNLPLYLLKAGDFKTIANRLSCNQDIASDGTFSIGMLAEFDGTLQSRGAWWYRRMYWEAGLLGHMMYLEAEAADIRATGIGCYFDDGVHDVLGIVRGKPLQSIYHLAVGGPILDERVSTLEPYHHIHDRSRFSTSKHK